MSLAEAQIGLRRETGLVTEAPGSRRETQSPAAAGVDALYVSIVQRHYESIVRYIHGMVPVPQQAEDLAQDTFLKAYIALSGSEVPANTRAWLFKIAANTTLDYVRRRRRIGMVGLDRVGHMLFGSDRVSDVDDAGPVDAALAALRADDRSVLLLFTEAGFAAPEVAEILGITPAAARKRRQRARDAFMTAYREASREV
jgi:RNA polymerase sigma-70 factor (ECF subfamily)